MKSVEAKTVDRQNLFLRANLLFSSCSIVGLMAIFCTFSSFSYSQTVANDNFFTVDTSQHLDVASNDENPAGQMIPFQPTYTSVGVATCPHCLFLSVPSSPGYVGFDSFVYRYSLPFPEPPSNFATVSLVVMVPDDNQNAGRSCPIVAEPVNVTNGNMWLEQRDYTLPGIGEPIDVNRFYNSIIQRSGLFGFEWTIQYDESIQIYGDKMIRYNQPDGRAAYFGRLQTDIPYKSFSTDVTAEVAANTDATFTLTHKDGRSRKFSSTGKLLSLKDANGNETTLAYNGNGLLVAVTDSAGRTLTLTPNSTGTIAQISDSTGVIADYAYETFSGVTTLKTVTYPDGSKYEFFYTTRGTKVLLRTVKDALNNVLETHEYDSQGRATTSEKHGGVEKYTFSYTTTPLNEPLTIVTDALTPARTTKYYYTRLYGTNLVTKSEGVCDCGGSGSETTTFTYDTNNSWLNLSEKTDALGRKTLYTYDDARNVTQIEEKLGTTSFGIQKWTYNSRGQVLTYKDRADSSGSSNTTVNTYDANGNLLTTKDALNNTTTLTYTTIGQLATVKDALNHTTTLTYDPQGRLTQIKDANDKNTNFGYDARVRVTSTTNTLNEVTTFEYDLNNRLKKVIYPDTNFVLNTYDLAGRRTGVTDERNNTTNYAYDGAYRLTSITDPLGHTNIFHYDLMSNMDWQTDALGNKTDFEYDDFNRLKKVIYPFASPLPSPLPSPTPTPETRLEESLTYDKLGNIKTKTNTDGKTTSYDYDNLNRLIKITDPLNEITQFEYNLRSQMTKVKDALNQEYIFTYDPLGRQLTQTRAGSTMTFEYDAVGNRTKRTDYTGRQTTYEYDVLNRLKKINYLTGGSNPTPGQNATYTYDDLSRLLTAVNQNGTVGITYDNRNRIKTTTDVFGHALEYGYDANSNRTQLKLDGSVHTTYAYDIANRLTTLTDEASQNFTFGYDIANLLISRSMPNGVTSTYDYDGMSRLTRLKDANTSATLFNRQYGYNNANQIGSITDLSGTRTFGYDFVDRLKTVTGSASETYNYDDVGNRTSSHLSTAYGYQSGQFNRLTSTTSATYGFDANGNTTTKSEGSNFWRYGWDHENRMVTASTRKNSVRYKYDALGRRIERNLQFGRERTKFTYDGDDVILDDDKSVLTKYLNGPGIDNKLRAQTGSTVSYFLADHLGSTNGIADATDAITSQTGYDSFGNPSNTTFPSRYQFTGREFDPFTGLQFSRARWYDPKIGRFISEDPIGFAGGDNNLYGYVRNQPLWFRDPSGLDPGADVMRDPNTWRATAAALAAVSTYVPPVAIAVVGAGAIYGAWHLGDYIARHPSNPFSKPWVSPDIIRPPVSRPYCEPIRGPAPRVFPIPRAMPFERSEPIPNSTPDEDEDRCAAQLARDESVCKLITDGRDRAACYGQAFARWAACLRKQPLPHFPWDDYPWN